MCAAECAAQVANLVVRLGAVVGNPHMRIIGGCFAAHWGNSTVPRAAVKSRIIHLLENRSAVCNIKLRRIVAEPTSPYFLGGNVISFLTPEDFNAR
jgi:hypothetical protein